MFENAIIKKVVWNDTTIYDGEIIASCLNNYNTFEDIGVYYKTILDFLKSSHIVNYDLCIKSFNSLLERSK